MAPDFPLDDDLPLEVGLLLLEDLALVEGPLFLIFRPNSLIPPDGALLRLLTEEELPCGRLAVRNRLSTALITDL